MIGDVYDTKAISAYQPSKEVADVTNVARRSYQEGYAILHRTWEELNYYSVIDRMNRDQRTFNAFVDEEIEDPREAWKWRGTRSLARNRAIAMHAHLTQSYIVPEVFAQNDAQESDEEMAMIARDGLEWLTINSNYRDSFLLATMGMLVNPVTFMGVEYREVMQKIKGRAENGEMMTKEIMDTELSGFDTSVWSADQILITNAYEQNIQRQKIINERRFIEYEEAKALYGDHENFDAVTPGVKSIYNDDDGLFYDIHDDDHMTTVEITVMKSRREDTEIPFVNGIYMGDENVDHNPISHRDHRGAPKYNKVPFGYERVNEHFFYYKSLMNVVGWDNDLLDAFYEITMNKEMLDLLPPLAISGEDMIDTEVIFPSSVVTFENPETKVGPLFNRMNNSNGYNAIQKIEESLKDSSISDTQAGALPDPNQKAFNVAQAATNAQILLGSVGKTLGQSVAQIGQLSLDIFVNNYTTAQVDEITGNVRYRNFILENKTVEGREVTKKILFDEALVGTELSDEEIDTRSLELLDRTDYPKSSEHIYQVNPRKVSMMEYLIRIEPDTMIPKNKAFEQAMAQQLYSLLRADPLVSPEALVRDLLNLHKKGRAEEFMQDQPAVPADVLGAQEEELVGTQAGAQAAAQAISPVQTGGMV